MATAIRARDNGIKAPVHILAIYPIAGADTNNESFVKYADAKPLDKPSVLWFLDKYLNVPAAANVTGLSTVTIINAEINPLQTEGRQLMAKLAAANVPVERKLYTGVTHEFFGNGSSRARKRRMQKIRSSEIKGVVRQLIIDRYDI